ncbi:MAG: universal stress protein, partial [Kamptonema sp. SIO4C4]|nr:universal stress protein [Kamptonema sp. SIO4C4]
ERLIAESVFNGVIVLMLITSLLGPILTSQFASRIAPPQADFDLDQDDWTLGLEWEHPSQFVPNSDRFTVVVPVYNPLTEKYLVEMGALLARHENGTVVPLSISMAHVHMDEPQLQIALKRSERLLDRAVEVSRDFNVIADPQIRIDDDIAHGISRVAREQKASLIVMGWSEKRGLRAKLFGNVIDQVFWSSHCPVAVMRLMDEPIDIHRILFPVKSITPVTVQTLRFAQLFADTNQATLTLLHVGDHRAAPEQLQSFEQQLWDVLEKIELTVKTEVKTIIHDDAAKVIVKAAQGFDMVILRSTRYRTAGGLAVSSITTQMMKELTCSLVLFGEPHS